MEQREGSGGKDKGPNGAHHRRGGSPGLATFVNSNACSGSACLNGSAYFKGNDRSPDGKVIDVGKAAQAMLGQILPDVFTRFADGAAKPNDVKRGLDALLTASDLQGLPTVFSALGLVRDEGGKTVFDTNAPALRDILTEIEHSANYGSKETGRSLIEKFGRDPYGWDFDVVRLFVAVLLRAGRGSDDAQGQHRRGYDVGRGQDAVKQ